MIAREHLPDTGSIASAQLRNVKVRNKAVGGKHTAGVGARALKMRRKKVLAKGLTMCFEFFDLGSFEGSLHADKRLATQMGGQRVVQVGLKPKFGPN